MISMKKTTAAAFLIIDVQNDFLPGGALPVEEGDEIIPKINQLQECFETIIATQDWHPADHISFASTHKKKLGERVVIKGLHQILWPIHCVEGSWGAAFPTSLNLVKIAKVFHKGVDPKIDSYSSFHDNAEERSTGLSQYLKDLKIQDLYVVGLATDYCVKYSVLDAIALGFHVFVIVDACRGIDLSEGDVEAALKEMKREGAILLSSAELLSQKR